MLPSQRFLACVFLFALRATAQAPAFDVASLKPSPPLKGDTYNANLGSVRHGELEMTNVTLADILRFAFAISNDQQIAGPDWIHNKGIRFDIVAKAPPDTPTEQVRLMLQGLTIERFQMVWHREPRELSYLALEVGKKGSKLVEAKDDMASTGNKFWIGDIQTNHVTMQMLVTVLSRFLREPVLDETGLQGSYEVHLKWVPEPKPGTSTAEAAEAGPSIYSAVQSQLGLQLQSRKGKVETIVVESALQVPTGN